MSFTDDFSSDRAATVQWQGAVGRVQFGNPDNLVVRFYNRSVLDPGQSKEAGHQVHHDVLYVTYHPPGERLNINDRPATQQDQYRWPTQWQQFSRQLEQRPDGMPIGLLYPTKPSVARTLEACGVFTVEALSALSAHAIEQIGMGAQTWVNDAQKYLEAANKGVKASQLASMLEERDGKIRALEQQLERAVGEIRRMQEGRPGVAMAGADPASIQQMVANAVAQQLSQRPLIPSKPEKGFDAQEAQINATRAEAIPATRRVHRKKGT